MKDLNKCIAEKYSAEEDSVRKEMNDAILLASQNPTPLWKLMFGENHIPDAEEFCRAVSKALSA